MGSLQLLVVTENVDVHSHLVGELHKAIPTGLGVRCVSSVTEGKRAIQQARPDAVIVDLDLTTGGGGGFVRSILRMGRRIPCVFLVGVLSDSQTELVALIRDHPEINFIERPFRPPVAARRIHSVLIPDHASDPSFYGLRLCELVQAFCLSRHDATLMVLTPDGHMGSVSIQGGQMIHVAFGGEEGMAALSRMVESQKGEIRVVPECLTAKRTIDRPTQQVLIEVYRQLDEARIVSGAKQNPTAQSPPRSPATEDKALMAELDAMFVPSTPEDAPLESPPAAPSACAQPEKPATAPAAYPHRHPRPPRPQVHNTYKGLPPQTFPPPGNAKYSGGANTTTRHGSTTSFLPKNIPPKTVQELLSEALEDE